MTLSAKSAFFVLFKAGLIDYCKKQKINEVEPISFNQLQLVLQQILAV
jgi:2-hydroxy-3-keto-5-methylthiopentenyl-1-phosphate phosphatase